MLCTQTYHDNFQNCRNCCCCSCYQHLNLIIYTQNCTASTPILITVDVRFSPTTNCTLHHRNVGLLTCKLFHQPTETFPVRRNRILQVEYKSRDLIINTFGLLSGPVNSGNDQLPRKNLELLLYVLQVSCPASCINHQSVQSPKYAHQTTPCLKKTVRTYFLS